MKNQPGFKISFIRILILASLLTGLILSACSASSPELSAEDAPVPSARIDQEPEHTPTPKATENPFGDWQEYTNEAVGFRFLYPAAWFGPEVYETDGTLRIEVGSDQVYTYGTSREDQISTIPDSYYVLIQYFENTEGRTWDDFINSGWIDTYLALQELGDGQFILTPRLVATRIGEINLGNFSGLMYLATIPDSAQTERAYVREVVLFDNDLNWLRISAFPNLVQIEDPENWKNDYARVDQANLEIFLTLVESITIE